MIVHTQNSRYRLNTKMRTWERLSTNGVVSDAPLRTRGGVYNELVRLKVGQGMVLLCPPLNPESAVRLITTSVVTRIER